MASDIERQNSNDREGEEDDANNTRHTRRCSGGSFTEMNLCYGLALAFGFVPPLLVLLKQISQDHHPSGLVYVGLLACVPPYYIIIKRSLSRNLFLLPSELKGMKDIYRQLAGADTRVNRLMVASRRMLARAALLASWWLVLNLLVPSLKRLTLLGSPLWIWSLLAFTILAAYFAAYCLSVLMGFPIYISNIQLQLVTLPFSQKRVPFPPISYDGDNTYLYFGLIPSITLVLYFGMLLGAWVGYFSTERGLKNPSIPNPEAFQYVRWTCVTLLIGSVLWFMKTLFILQWTAIAIYGRFETRILITGVQLLYLSVIVGKFFSFWIIDKMELLDEYARQPEKFVFTNYISSKQHLNTAYLQTIGQRLTSLAKFVRPLPEDGVPELFNFFYKHTNDQDHTEIIHECQPEALLKLLEYRGVDKEFLRWWYEDFCWLSKKDIYPSSTFDKQTGKFLPEVYCKNTANVLHSMVREQYASAATNQITFDDLNKWMVDAHMNCVNMGRTLADATAIVTRLDIFISFVILVVVLLLWLLITGIATTTILVTIATPFFAMTFIFGDSAKAFFQGIIFCFGTHAFDVGDRCILDDTELEVKRISILTTTFIKIGSAEKRMYPNSVLATKAIVNLGWQPDPSDIVELTLDYSTKRSDWQILEKKVLKFFNDPQQKEMFQSSHEVMMKETADKIKVTIHFKHVLTTKEMTHGQCFHKKNRQRSIILKEVSHFIDPSSPAESDEKKEGLTNSEVVPMNDHKQTSNTGEITKP